MLSSEEKEYLYQIIAAIVGEDASIKSYTLYFNDQTVVAVEQMAEENFKCNANMKELIKGLLGGAANLSRGWLHRLLKNTKKKLSKSELNGYGCLVQSKATWKSTIIATTI